jgi:hypothetical protein
MNFKNSSIYPESQIANLNVPLVNLKLYRRSQYEYLRKILSSLGSPMYGVGSLAALGTTMGLFWEVPIMLGLSQKW